MPHQSDYKGLSRKGVQDLCLPGFYQLQGELGVEIPDATRQKVLDNIADAYERGGIEAAKDAFNSGARRIRSDVSVQRIAR